MCFGVVVFIRSKMSEQTFTMKTCQPREYGLGKPLTESKKIQQLNV